MNINFIKRNSRYLPFIIIIVVFISCDGDTRHPPKKTTEFSRIISFAPSITETLFALSLGEKVVGVTSFCMYPPQARRLPKVGGYIDPNFEMIIRLKPDLVVMLKEQEQLRGFLNANHIAYLTIDNHDLNAILSSIKTIGGACGRENQADSLVGLISGQCRQNIGISTKVPRVLLCVDRNFPGNGAICRVYAAGPTTFYNDLLSATGMENALTKGKIEYQQLSAEGVISLQPDIIIDLSAPSGALLARKALKDWQLLPGIPAIKNRMLFSLSADYMTVPGPRVFLILKDFKRIMKTYQDSTVRKP